jgi:hypothetical protein
MERQEANANSPMMKYTENKSNVNRFKSRNEIKRKTSKKDV